MLRNYICALDISSSKVSAAVAEVKKRHITNIFFETQIPSKGIRKGAIVNSIDLTGSIGRTLKNLKAKSGINIKFIYTNISGFDIVTKHSRAIIPLAERGNKVITLSDIQQANEQARILGSSLEEETIHQIAQNYAIDSNSNILNPLGLYSHRLEVDLYLISAKSSFMHGLSRAVNQAGYEIRDLFLSGLATSEAVFNKELKEGVTVLCDIGSDITELLLFSDGILKDVRILTVGGNDLTIQLEEKLKIAFALAEDVKISYGSVGDYNQTHNDKEILIKQNNAYKPINQRSVSEILTSKSKLICQTIKDSMGKIVSFDEVDNFVTTGRTVLLEGFLEMLENNLGISVKLGRITNPNITAWVNKDNTISGQRYLTYVTSLGIICQALYQPQPKTISAHQPTQNPILNTINKFKELYQEYF
ncbi:MAG: cell division protein FtsA [Candidatus Omnitrophota bacterium]|nr:cell division protein FtsA [Candidatus Omnitrophota bacterium]